MQSGFARVNGTKLYHEVAGSGETVVFVHGFGLDRRMWDDQFGTFAEKYRVIRYDLRGFGRSALPDRNGYTHAEDLKSLLNHLGIGRASIVGLSLGGGVAISFALTFPEMAHKLVLADSILDGYMWSAGWKTSMERIGDAAKSAGENAARKLWLDHPLFAPARERPGVAQRLAAMVSGFSGWHWLNDDPRREIHPYDMERLAALRSPTLIILGERDLPDFHAIATILQERIPNARTSELERVGHMVNMEAPERFNRVALRFLQNGNTGKKEVTRGRSNPSRRIADPPPTNRPNSGRLTRRHG